MTARLSLVGLALIPLFGLAEVVVIHLPTQRNAHGHTLREVPAVVGLTFLAPQEYLLVYVVGTVSALFLVTHMRGVKLAFNAALFAFEAGLGAAVYHLILDGGDPISPWGWLAALAAVVSTDLISAAAITTAISVTEGAFDGEVLRETLRSGLAPGSLHQHLRGPAGGDPAHRAAVVAAPAGRRRGPAGPGLPGLHRPGARPRPHAAALPLRGPDRHRAGARRRRPCRPGGGR